MNKSSFLHVDATSKTILEQQKSPKRTDIINYLLSLFDRETTYLEIGIRDPENNFNHIQAHTKYGVDPGVEQTENLADFKMTSDEFFRKLKQGIVLSKNIKFDVIFIDGLHLANQVEKDIHNSWRFLAHNGFIVLHDCNPPTEWHCREEYDYHNSPAGIYWNGTTWKAFMKQRCDSSIYSCCVDSDWGVGILSAAQSIGCYIKNTNPFYEFKVLDDNRVKNLNLITFEEFKKILN